MKPTVENIAFSQKQNFQKIIAHFLSFFDKKILVDSEIFVLFNKIEI